MIPKDPYVASLCNCWVAVDGSGCHCGDLDLCINHTPCRSNADCKSNEVCIENCCGKLCYAPCSQPAGAKRPKKLGAKYGIR
jgi:hypothetical protein